MAKQPASNEEMDECYAQIAPVDEARVHEVQRPNIQTPTDPRGGFTHNPEFELNDAWSGGHIWNSKSGNHTNHFVRN